MRGLKQATLVVLSFLCSLTAAAAADADGNRLAYLHENNPYYVSHEFPKLTTPQWVGEEGVDAVVVLAIDDMRDTQKYEDYLRPILVRLKQIDGRAPVSIMTCNVDPREEQLQQWLAEGLSIEIHTVDHPCPLLKGGDFAKAKSTYDRCVDLMHQIPGNKPVAFRTPCCDSLNTVSPRFYAEIFNQTTPEGHFLQIDSSVFNVFTADDPENPRELVLEPAPALSPTDGTSPTGGDAQPVDTQERFRKYLPADRGFVNYVENYPYPYVINGLCWQFPCVTPSDWSAQHLHGKNNPKTVDDWKAALDITVKKQGVFCLVFHPHGWIRNDQIVELIDHAVEKHGKKVKFLTFREAAQRLNENMIKGRALRGADGSDGMHRLLDVNADGYFDVLLTDVRNQTRTRVWSPKHNRWTESRQTFRATHSAYGIVDGDPYRFSAESLSAWQLSKWQRTKDNDWSHVLAIFDFPGEKFDLTNLSPERRLVNQTTPDRFVRMRDFDADGQCELIVSRDNLQALFRRDKESKHWTRLPFSLPPGVSPNAVNDDKASGLRFVDIDEDGRDDVVFSNHQRYGIWLFKDMQTGWSIELLAGKRGEKDANDELPPIVREDGSDNGFFVHSRQLIWQNEDTDTLPHLVDRRSFDELLKDQMPGPKSPRQSLKLMRPRPGFHVELVASEPLIADPVAFEWGPDGRLWVVEMGDYPSGSERGGRVKFLEDTDGDGRYDTSTLFLDGLNFPTGVMPWREGVLVSAAPDIFYAADTNDDGRADHRETLLSGFSEGNQQHRVNGFAYGLDNWVYCANGDSGGTVTSPKHSEKVVLGSRDFRMRPETGEVDLQAGRTQFGRHRDDWGNWFGCNNSRPIFHFALTDHYLRRNSHVAFPDGRVEISVAPGTAPCFPISRPLIRFNDFDKLNRFTSACSVMIYRDDLFGPEFAGNWFVSEPVHNLVHREVVSPRGVTFESRRAASEHSSEFLASRDNWFRPTTIKTGPDGALWIADMYRLVIEHPQWIPAEWQQRLDLRSGSDRGRIYRIFPADHTPRAIPALDRLSTAELVAALDSPSGWQRDTAQRLLVHRGDAAASPLLSEIATGSRRPTARLHALCTLDGLQALTPEMIVAALSDQHAGVRRHAIRLSEQFAGAKLSDRVLHAVLKCLDDPEPQVQLQLAYSLGEWTAPEAAAALGRLAARHQHDEFLAAAVLSSVHERNLAAVLAAMYQHVPRGPAATQLLRMAATVGEKSLIGQIVERITESPDDIFQAWQYRGLSELYGAQPNLSDRLDTSQRQRIAVVLESAIRTTFDEGTDSEHRTAAVQLLGIDTEHRQSGIQTLKELLVPQSPPEMQMAIVEQLSRFAEPIAAEALLAGWKAHVPDVRARIVEVVLQRASSTEVLLNLLEADRILPQEITAAHRTRLLEHYRPGVRARAKTIFAGDTNSDRREVVASHHSALELAADVIRGKAIFTKRCGTCHKFRGEGKELGPDLAALKDKSPEALLAAILDPNRAVESKFLVYTALTTTGITHTGLLTGEAGNSLTLTSADGKPITLLRSQLEAFTSSNKSFMPEGLERDLTPQDLADVIAFLRQSER